MALKRAEAINAMVRSAHASLNSKDSNKLKKQQQKAKAGAGAAEPAAGGADDSAPRLPEPGDLVFVPSCRSAHRLLGSRMGKSRRQTSRLAPSRSRQRLMRWNWCNDDRYADMMILCW